MSLLTLIQDCCKEIGLPSPSSAVGSNNETVVQLIRFTYRTGQELQMLYDWPQLAKETTITLVASQANYALPADFLRQVTETHWDQDNSWQLLGPVTPQEWNLRQHGVVSSGPRRRFRVKGIADNQFYIHPTPDSGDAGVTLSYEYLSTIWFRPPAWANSTVYSAGDYVFENGTVYQTAAGGTSSGTGTSDDTGVTDWTASTTYAAFTEDTDVFILDEDIVSLGVIWRWLRSKGQPYKDIQADYEVQAKRRATNYKGSRSLSLVGGRSNRILSSRNVPETGIGQ